MKTTPTNATSIALRRYLLSTYAREGLVDQPESLPVLEALIAHVEMLEQKYGDEEVMPFMGLLLNAIPASANASGHPDQRFCSLCAAMNAAEAFSLLVEYAARSDAHSDRQASSH